MPTATALRTFLPAALAAAFVALPATAQSIRAVARDAATGAPVAEAMVRVEAADGTLRAVAFADSSGVAVLRLREPGTYRVEARRAGYSEGAVQVEAGGGQTQADIRLARRPITLDTVVAFGRMELERGRDGFERRRATSDGVFLDSAYLQQRSGRVAYVGDMLAGVPGVYTQRTPRGMTAVRSTRGWQCMVMLLDGRPFALQFPDGGRRELHQVIGPRDIEGVEVYREWSEVPPEFQQYASRGRYRCGVYLYWTRAAW
jgi:hypothetical protein